ncbi:flagellar motor protein MotD [Cognatiluteimonas weifangensis]|uniref:Flagellar motor protein MotD n=1 Tax=Cognatiluteimonas weifangensis TaxID=2303539 RepID=A0A372DR28_9GAMM|nr:flagellar motor protein MotD [Luteimonas weifangensis]RFP62031.1 flagellar motor protein MotD [Luteimonas weifangensis]
MARRHPQHEEHQNHEAWAIPYADLLTLLLAFFVVMYAVSSINEGKYRVLADAMSAAFGGTPRTIAPIQLGRQQLRGSAFDRPSLATPGAKTSGPAAPPPVEVKTIRQVLDLPTFAHAWRKPQQGKGSGAGSDGHGEQLRVLGDRLQQALSGLVRRKLVTVRRARTYLEVEIQSDVLFASGVAVPDAKARGTIAEIAKILRDEPNAVRVEGYTDNKPIHTWQFNSNWELSAARAASVVHVMIAHGVAPAQLAVVGYGEQQPVADNRTPEGRNANRRVLLVILAAPQGVDAIGPETVLADTGDAMQEPAPAAAAAPTRDAPPSADTITLAHDTPAARQPAAGTGALPGTQAQRIGGAPRAGMQ